MDFMREKVYLASGSGQKERKMSSVNPTTVTQLQKCRCRIRAMAVAGFNALQLINCINLDEVYRVKIFTGPLVDFIKLPVARMVFGK